MQNANIEGFVAPGFEPVREVFAENFRSRSEVGAACAAYLHGEPVVDLWGGVADPTTGRPWEKDTLVLVFSTTKGVASMAMAVAHSRGLLDYDEKVARYWPEFGAHGKSEVTVRQLLSHQAGLAAVDAPIDLATLDNPDRLAEVLAAQPPNWKPGERHGYHGVTLGFYESALLRRVDPQHRTLGRFFADEVAAPLGLEFYIGLPASVPRERVARILGDRFALRMLGNLHKLPGAFVLGFINPFSVTARAFSNPAALGQPHQYNTEALRALELPASNGIGQVRSVAKAYGELARGAPTLGLHAATLAALEQRAVLPSRGDEDVVLRRKTAFSLGYCKPFPGFDFGTDGRAYGTMGAGGSLGYADPSSGLGFAYAMNRMDFYLFNDPREHELSKAVRACALAAGGRSAARLP
jgi:CubicO group peptidase (beta-lactamase class C family)